MKSETFHCPHCRTVLKKSAAAWVLGEMSASKGARGVMMGAPAPAVPCPACGGTIDTAGMVSGKYDAGGGIGDVVGLVAGLFGMIALIAAYDLSWWLAGIIALVGGVLVGRVVDFVARKLS